MQLNTGRAFLLHFLFSLLHFLFLPTYLSITGPGSPGGVVAAVESTSVRVSWGAVDDAHRYTITFTQPQGANQEGLCPTGSHTTSLTIRAPSTTVSIAVGEDVETGVTDMLRAYTKYEVTVVAVSDILGTSPPMSETKSVLTPQTGKTD